MLDSIFSRLVRGSWRRAALALGLFCVAGAAQAAPVSLATPAGLNPGDTFRFLFVTSTTRNATSTDIADYNAFVNTDAGGATYGGTTVNWNAVGSTSTVDARDNVGGFGTAVPVYLANGTKLANDLTTNLFGLWGGNLRAVPNITIDGLSLGASDPTTFTGSLSDGTSSGDHLGNITATRGVADVTTSSWIELASSFYGVSYRFYGLSDDLTVASAVPEIDPAGIGSVLALVTGALGLLERRRLKVT
jgi:hypothetical protein